MRGKDPLFVVNAYMAELTFFPALFALNKSSTIYIVALTPSFLHDSIMFYLNILLTV